MRMQSCIRSAYKEESEGRHRGYHCCHRQCGKLLLRRVNEDAPIELSIQHRDKAKDVPNKL